MGSGKACISAALEGSIYPDKLVEEACCGQEGGRAEVVMDWWILVEKACVKSKPLLLWLCHPFPLLRLTPAKWCRSKETHRKPIFSYTAYHALV